VVVVATVGAVELGTVVDVGAPSSSPSAGTIDDVVDDVVVEPAPSAAGGVVVVVRRGGVVGGAVAGVGAGSCGTKAGRGCGAGRTCR